MAESEMSNRSASPSPQHQHTEQFFEGVEKLLEIWFVANKNTDLRKIPRQKWEKLLQIVGCEIISFTRSEQVDAYVLSESSMFVSRSRWILKTCGTTTPLLCLAGALELAGAPHLPHSPRSPPALTATAVDRVFYSRREFAKPDRQRPPHLNFEAEVELLATYFGEGSAYVLGPEKDCWYLYTSLPLEGTVGALMKQDQHEKLLSRISRMQRSGGNGAIALLDAPRESDQTIEILMSDLDPEVMDIFTKKVAGDGAHATRMSGIDKLIPGMVIDDFLFDPCGYSMNGVMENGYYMTIHVTPERGCSYVSFESNAPPSAAGGRAGDRAAGYEALVARVVAAFRPTKFVLTVFRSADGPEAEASAEEACAAAWKSGEFARREWQFCRLAGYVLHYALYCKFPS